MCKLLRNVNAPLRADSRALGTSSFMAESQSSKYSGLSSSLGFEVFEEHLEFASLSSN